MYGEIMFKDESHHTKVQVKDDVAFKCEIANNVSQPTAIQTDLNKRVYYKFMEKGDE